MPCVNSPESIIFPQPQSNSCTILTFRSPWSATIEIRIYSGRDLDASFSVRAFTSSYNASFTGASMPCFLAWRMI